MAIPGDSTEDDVAIGTGVLGKYTDSTASVQVYVDSSNSIPSESVYFNKSYRQLNQTATGISTAQAPNFQIF